MEIGKSTQNSTYLGNVLYKNVRVINCLGLINQTYIPILNLHPLPLVNAPNDSITNNHCYMAEEVHVKTTKVPQSRNLTPVTIMVADTIGIIKSRRLLKVLLDSGSMTTLINKRCLPRKCQPCKTSQSRW